MYGLISFLGQNIPLEKGFSHCLRPLSIGNTLVGNGITGLFFSIFLGDTIDRQKCLDEQLMGHSASGQCRCTTRSRDK
ncbi:hypothetical protein E4T56_gene19125 [Termitomyces sp. T112]|nr:hypothetical protein E4T56_gene19125 [Termitomyces sp. T112]